eukprot:6173511-Pleurochrysis_carterae.AAC.2
MAHSLFRYAENLPGRLCTRFCPCRPYAELLLEPLYLTPLPASSRAPSSAYCWAFAESILPSLFISVPPFIAHSHPVSPARLLACRSGACARRA